MNDIRAKFEEIWPAPEGVYWYGEYSTHLYSMLVAAREHNARLDTFTRCQETQALVITLIDDLAYDLERAYNHLKRGTAYNTHSLDRAKQILGRE